MHGLFPSDSVFVFQETEEALGRSRTEKEMGQDRLPDEMHRLLPAFCFTAPSNVFLSPLFLGTACHAPLIDQVVGLSLLNH